jgi:hypothetical protein
MPSRLDRRAVAGFAAVAAAWCATAGLAVWLVAVRGGHLPRWVLGGVVAIGLVLARGALARAASTGELALAVGAGVEVGSLSRRARRGPGRRRRRGRR